MGLVRVANVEGSLEGNMTLVRWLAMTSRLAREGRRLGSLHLRDCLAQEYRGRGLAVSRRPGCHQCRRWRVSKARRTQQQQVGVDRARLGKGPV